MLCKNLVCLTLETWCVSIQHSHYIPINLYDPLSGRYEVVEPSLYKWKWYVHLSTTRWFLKQLNFFLLIGGFINILHIHLYWQKKHIYVRTLVYRAWRIAMSHTSGSCFSSTKPVSMSMSMNHSLQKSGLSCGIDLIMENAMQ